MNADKEAVERWNAITAERLAEDRDHLRNPPPEQAAWAVAQLAAWPTRIHPERTTNDRFLRMTVARLAQAGLALQEEGVEERIARVLCEASSETWREGTYEVMSGPNWEMEDHPLDPFNNHWRFKARAILNSLKKEKHNERR